MKKIFTLLFLSTAFTVIGQNFSVEKLDTTLVGNPNSSDFAGYIYIYNDTQANLTMRWVRITDSASTNWYTSVCDPGNCAPPQVDSANFTLKPNLTTQYMNVHFYPEKTEGEGIIRIKLFEVSSPDSFIVLTFKGEAYLEEDSTSNDSTLSISENLERNTVVYPTTVENDLFINTPIPDLFAAKIFDLQGRTLLEEEFFGTNHAMNLASLKKGVYILSISNGKQRVNRKITKQ